MSKKEAMEQIEEVWEKSEDELYEYIGMAALGTGEISIIGNDMAFLNTLASNTDASSATKALKVNLLGMGKKYFKIIWNKLKDTVCAIYSEGGQAGDAKDLAAYIVSALVAAGKIANQIASWVVAIAVKKGLDKMCST